MKKNVTTYQASRLRRTQFRHFGDVIIDGPVDIKNHLIVVGDLTVHGDLDAHGVFCFGSLRVTGNLKAGLVVTVGGIDITGNACAITMESGAAVDYTASMAELPEDASSDPETYLARWRGDGFFDDLEDLRQSGFAQVTIGGYLDLCTCDIAYGLQVGDWFDLDTGFIGGPTTARQLYIEEDLRVHGSVSVVEGIEGGELFAGDLDVGGHVDIAKLSTEEDVLILGHLHAGDIDVGGALSVETCLSSYGKVIVGTSLSAGEAILVKEQIQVGAEYGILCGLRVPRSEWPQRGWLSCAKPPEHLYTGVFIKKRNFETASERLRSLESAKKG
jgi:cytoskeletal protein CcmA (bactofilin family)